MKVNYEILTEDFDYLKEEYNIEVTDELLKLREHFEKVEKFLEKLKCKFYHFYEYTFEFDVVYQDRVVGHFAIGGAHDDVYDLEVHHEANFSDYFWYTSLENNEMLNFLESLKGNKKVKFKNNVIQYIVFYENLLDEVEKQPV